MKRQKYDNLIVFEQIYQKILENSPFSPIIASKGIFVFMETCVDK